jgi:hypothetical protein
MADEHGALPFPLLQATLMVNQQPEQSSFHQLLSQRLRIESLNNVGALLTDRRFDIS